MSEMSSKGQSVSPKKYATQKLTSIPLSNLDNLIQPKVANTNPEYNQNNFNKHCLT